MIYPTLPTTSSYRETVEEFRGYDRNLRIGAGEFYDMENLTSDYYPVLSPRKARGFYKKPEAPNGLIAKEKLCYVNGSKFVFGEESVELGLSAGEDEPAKTMVSMGAYVIILPDKKYVNTANLSDHGDIEAAYESTGTVTYTLCTLEGTEISGVTASETAPASPENMQYWIDTSAKPHALKRYTTITKTWVIVATTYVKISATGIGDKFGVYDGVKLSGITAEGLEDLNGSAVIWGKDSNYIIVVGLLDKQVTQTGAIQVKRGMPDMDFITESGNRLWGCRYGEAAGGENVNEIYACKLGDFKNWNCFLGTSTDSYAASCGTDGAFTGAVTHLGYPLFFKEDCVHKVYGTMPSNFQIQTTTLRGVQSGCGRSLAVVNETLFYKSRSGICAYDGSFPADVSEALGKAAYTDAVACAHGNKYYISMMDADGVWALFVYDTAKGLWHKEDALHVSSFASFLGELYVVDAENKNILTLLGSGESSEDSVEWMAETGDLGLDSPDSKYISQVSIRLRAETQTQMKIYIRYDHDWEWLEMCNILSLPLGTITVPIRPRRCDHMRLRIVGKGDAKIYSIVKTISQGSDRFG